jgi:hypothetical protein
LACGQRARLLASARAGSLLAEDDDEGRLNPEGWGSCELSPGVLRVLFFFFEVMIEVS